MKTVLVKKRGCSGAPLGFKKIVLLESFLRPYKKTFRPSWLVNTEHGLTYIDFEDLVLALDDYRVSGVKK